ncbi:MAG TPA: endolytic transglycosylase MltG [Rhizomicrobium sp.]|nr:endolytic transglycosylase MltG [Rhizomicrobium sp.]
MVRFLIVLLVLAVIVAGAFEWESANFSAAGPAAANNASETDVVIEPHVGLRGIAQELAAAGVIGDPNLFIVGVRLRRTAAGLKAGEFAIPSRASMYDIMDILIEGKSIQHKLTAAEGLTSDMIAKLIDADPVLLGAAVAVPAEGSLLPETYLFTRGTSRAELVARMQRAQQELLSRLWAGRAAGLPLKTPQDAVILASIVEKETSLPDERRHIAAIFVNRLRLGMKLQSDPTIIYTISGGYPLGRGIRESELVRATAYNTYVIAGLPPTPICNPGKDSLEAVLNPGESKDLYFVASGNGGHVFSANIADQARNVAALRARERAAAAGHK